MKEMKRIRHFLLLNAVIWTAVLLANASCSRSYPPPDATSREHYKSECAPIITWATAEYDQHGTYPDQLPDKYSSILSTLGPPSAYGSARTSFWIRINSYQTDSPWMLYYDSRQGTWRMDG
jgi:hypothetical protein